MNRYDVIAVGGGRTLALAPAVRRRRGAATRRKGARRRFAVLARASEPKLSTEELRDAVRAPGRITGRAGMEDVLDAVFASFCVGN